MQMNNDKARMTGLVTYPNRRACAEEQFCYPTPTSEFIEIADCYANLCYHRVDCSKMRVGTSDRVSSVPACPGTRGGKSGHTTKNPCRLLSCASWRSRTCLLQTDSNVFTTAPRKSTHHTTATRDALFTHAKPLTLPPASEQYQGQPSSLQNVAAPSFPTSHILLQGGSRVSCTPNLRLLRSR